MSYIDDSIKWTAQWEGDIPWMYLDTEGNVTVACGIELPDAGRACSLPFVDSLDEPADESAIAADFNRVKNMKAGELPGYYHEATGIHLDHQTRSSLMRTMMEQEDKDMRGDWAGWDGLPDGVKLAIMDMDYNLGTTKLLGKFPKFDAAIDSRDWATAAIQCHRQDISDARNEWTKNLFLQAAAGA